MSVTHIETSQNIIGNCNELILTDNDENITDTKKTIRSNDMNMNKDGEMNMIWISNLIKNWWNHYFTINKSNENQSNFKVDNDDQNKLGRETFKVVREKDVENLQEYDLQIGKYKETWKNILLSIIRLVLLFTLPLELFFFWLWSQIPLDVRHSLINFGFFVLVRIHTVLGLKTGHESLSFEAHAVTSMFYFGFLFPVNLRRMRFALNQIESCYPPLHDMPCEKVDELKIDSYFIRYVDPAEAEATNLTSFNQNGDNESSDLVNKKSSGTLLWFFGGAFVGGSAKSNIGIASRMAKRAKCNVLCAGYRRAPDEGTIVDAIDDAMEAYKWLLKHEDPSRIFVTGISSGGGISLLLLQQILEIKEIPMPAGAVLFGPWIMYKDHEENKSIHENTKHDLVVTSRVHEFIFPIMDSHILGNLKDDISPVHGRLNGLPPIHLSVSELEVCIDENRMLERRLREAKVDVTFRTRPHLMHAFQLFSGFIPEAEEVIADSIKWIEKIANNKKN